MSASAGLPALATAAVPRATYRLQFHAKFRLQDALDLVPYLQSLGISHLYASSYLKARAGSKHGYDVVDHNALNPEIGSESDLEALCLALADAGMSQMLDVVPNHMGVLAQDNAWWTDVVENGVLSPWAEYFDIDWSPQDGQPQKLLLAVLGRQFGAALREGDLRLDYDAAFEALCVRHEDTSIPLDPRTYGDVLKLATFPADLPDLREQAGALLARFDDLQGGELPAVEDRFERHAQVVGLKSDLARLMRSAPPVEGWVRDGIAACNDRSPRDAPDGLADLIGKQPWRLAYWRVAAHEVNYRRFFEVSSLAALRMEDRRVFDDAHRTVLRWLKEGKVGALRIDHPDGLAEPADYFRRLQAAHLEAQRERGHDAAPRALYIAVEKILAEHEAWPDGWSVHGETGYRYANQANGLFVRGENASAFDALYADFIGRRADYGRELVESKRYVIAKLLASDLHSLVETAFRLAQEDLASVDFTRVGLREAITELAVGMPVYRIYVGVEGLVDTDRRQLEWAARNARHHAALDETDTLDFVVNLMLEPAPSALRLAFIHRFQQFTAPVMAKAMEDTAFYRYHRLISLNDVGGDPAEFGVDVKALHGANLARLRQVPHGMLAGTTHDSKRAEDVRARLDVLSEMPDAWSAALGRWRELRLRQVGVVEGAPVLEPNDEILLFQSLVGMLPAGPLSGPVLDSIRERLNGYLLKAMREAKQITSWLRPNEAYEAEVARTVDSLLAIVSPNPFLSDVRAFVEDIAGPGYANSLCLVALKMTAPGLPDVYQGCEAWKFDLVDPDNRRPVDHGQLRRQLEDIRSAWLSGPAGRAALLRRLLEAPDDGQIKLLVTWRLLACRAEQAALFESGDYQALEVEGPAANHVFAFARQHGASRCITVVSRFRHTLAAPGRGGIGVLPDRWAGTVLKVPAGGDAAWIEAVTGREIVLERQGAAWTLALQGLLSEMPFAVLVRAASAGRESGELA